MLFQGVSSFFFTLATPFSLLFLLVGINALVVALWDYRGVTTR